MVAGSFAEFQAEIQRLLKDGQQLRARHYLTARTNAASALHEYAWLAKSLASLELPATELPVAVLSSVTIDALRPILQAQALANGFDVRPYFGAFGQFETEVAPAGGAVAHNPRVAVFAWRLEDIAPQLCTRVLEFPPQTVQLESDALLQRLSGIVQLAHQSLPAATLLLHSFVPPDAPPLGILDHEQSVGLTTVVRRLNQGLLALAHTTPGVHMVDCERLARHSAAAWHDPRYAFRARAPHGVAALAMMAREYVKYFRAISGQTKKVLVVDLDNTMWGGIVGEDGVGGIQIGHDYPGNCFLAFQQELRQLAARGVVLAINSKNNEADVQEVFARRSEMLLKLEDFAVTRINWQNKVQNMRELAEELSLGLDSFVFVDDNPAELEIVQQELPMVTVLAVPPEPAELPGQLTRLGYFDALAFTPEDRQRTQMYRAEAGRRQLERGSTDLESFWRSLDMKLTVLDVGTEEMSRVSQLTQRTNQFNMTTRRYTEADLQRLRQSGEHQIRAYRLEDRFGDYGIIAVTIVRTGKPEWIIDTFLMSCRVIGRTVEHAILSLVALDAQDGGAKVVIGDLIPTRKNTPAQKVYAEFGFAQAEALPEGGTRYKLALYEPFRQIPDWINVVRPASAGAQDRK